MTGTVTATFEGLTRGTVEFTTNTADGVLRDPTGKILWAGPKKVRIVGGAISVTLPATDDTAYAETGWQWRAAVKLDGRNGASFIRWFELPDASTVDLADIAGELTPGDPLTHPTAFADVVAGVQDPNSVLGQALSASIDARALVKDGTLLQRLRDAGDGLAQTFDIRHRGTSGYVFHSVTEAGSGGFLAAYGTDEGAAGAILRSHKNSAASEHAIGHGGSSILNFWQGYSQSTLLNAEVYANNQGLKVFAKTGSGYGDGVSTASSTTFTSAGAAFTAGDVGQSISQTTTRGSLAPSGCIPTGTTISSVTNATTVELSQAATASGTTVPFLVAGRAPATTQPLQTFYDTNGTTKLLEIALGKITGNIPLDVKTNDVATAAAVIRGMAGQTAEILTIIKDGTASGALSVTAAGIVASRFGASVGNAAGGTSGTVSPLSVTNTSTHSSANTVLIKASSGQTAAQLAFQTSAGANQTRFNKDAVFMTKAALPADGDITAGEVSLSFDSTNGAAKLKIKGKSADGTVVAGEVALA